MVLVVMTPCFSQLMIRGPKNFVPSSQLWGGFEAREKQQAVMSTKGVVGSSGTKMPIRPMARLSQPRDKSARRDTPFMVWLWFMGDSVPAINV